MSEDLKNLENHINALISACEQLKQENHALREQNGDLSQQHTQLLEKTRVARGRIEDMINRLKALERS